MSLAERYLNITNNNFTFLVDNEELNENIKSYQENFVLNHNNPENLKNNLLIKIHDYIDNVYNKINIEGADINYYLEHINLESKIKFVNIISLLKINNIISMMDYGQKHSLNNHYINFRYEYFKYFNLRIINGKYNINKTNGLKTLHELINDNWSNINFDNLINFTSTINRMKFFNLNIDIFKNIFENKFNSKDNIDKLIVYLTQNFIVDTETNQSDYQINNDFSDEYDNENYNEFENDLESRNKKFNFRFIIDNLKSNGYGLFEEYQIQVFNRYKHSIVHEQLKKDISLIHYFMKIISQKEATNVNRCVNEILIRIRDYLFDIEDSYNSNQDYQKIRIDLQSEKYKTLDLKTLKRDKHNFIMLKYLFGDPIIKNYKINKSIEPYFDIYKAFYSNRYPDREISYDIIKSSITGEIEYTDTKYYIHMATIQYIVLDAIMNSKSGLTVNEISTQTNIPVISLKETINSLLKIKLVGKTNGKSIESIKIIENPNFSYEKTKISIYSLVQNDKLTTNIEKPREFLHDRNIIVYSNLIDYVKKNKYFYQDTIEESIKYRIPFTITNEQLEYSINQALKDTIVNKIQVDTNEQILYQYNE
jgi:hypothetical protein